MAHNPWTDQMLALDYHAGDRTQAAIITAENGNDAPIYCGICNGDAHYKHTIGTEKCTACHAIHLGYGDWVPGH